MPSEDFPSENFPSGEFAKWGFGFCHAPKPNVRIAPGVFSRTHDLFMASFTAKQLPKEFQGPQGPEPTRYGDWERKGIASDF